MNRLNQMNKRLGLLFKRLNELLIERTAERVERLINILVVAEFVGVDGGWWIVDGWCRVDINGVEHLG